MRFSLLTFVFTLVATTYPRAGTDPSMDWFHIRSTASGGDVQSPNGTVDLPVDARAERFQRLAGTVDLPADAKPENCHLTLRVGSREAARWFPDTSSRTIRFEFTVYDTDFPHQVALVLSDCPLAIKSTDDLKGRFFFKTVQFGNSLKEMTVSQ